MYVCVRARFFDLVYFEIFEFFKISFLREHFSKKKLTVLIPKCVRFSRPINDASSLPPPVCKYPLKNLIRGRGVLENFEGNIFGVDGGHRQRSCRRNFPYLIFIIFYKLSELCNSWGLYIVSLSLLYIYIYANPVMHMQKNMYI